MLDNIMLQALNEQLNVERFNQASYDMLAASLDVAYWPGSSAWMKGQAQEEATHADKVAAYIVDRGCIPQFTDIVPIPMIDTANLTNAFEAALQVEQANTERIKMLYHLAEEQADPQTCQFLHWFLAEQTEAEGVLGNYLTMLDRLDANGKMVFDSSVIK